MPVGLKRLRVIFCGTGGPLSSACVRALAADHDVVAMVRPVTRGWWRYRAGRWARRLSLLSPDPHTVLAREVHADEWPVSSVGAEDLAARVRAANADVICAAHFPWRLPAAVLAATPFGGVNVHPSLLPRHRGVLPWFWVYHANDREGGLTVHQMTEEFDAGAVLGQQRVPLPRGYPVDRFHLDVVQSAGPLVQHALRAMAGASLEPRVQDAQLATRAPRVRPGTPMVDFAQWEAERVWHFLAGLWPRWVEPLVDDAGAALSYRGVEGFDAGARVDERPGAAKIDRHGRLALQCVDGVVYLTPSGGPRG